MSKSGTLILLGIIVALSPFLGLPSFWLSLILILCGVAVFFVGFFIRRERVPALEREVQ